MMTISRKLFMTASLFCLVGIAVPFSDAATSFNGSTIIGIDQSERTITFRTKEGEKWTLPVEKGDLLKDKKIAQGDQVSIEIDLNDRITNIVKPSDQPNPSQNTPKEE